MRGVTYNATNNPDKRIISTHTPHARRDVKLTTTDTTRLAFQLTRLMRGVTFVGVVSRVIQKFQLTRLMRGVTF